MTRLIKSIFTNNATVHHELLMKHRAAGGTVYHPSNPMSPSIFCLCYNHHHHLKKWEKRKAKKIQRIKFPFFWGFIRTWSLRDVFWCRAKTDNKRQKVQWLLYVCWGSPGCGKNCDARRTGGGDPTLCEHQILFKSLSKSSSKLHILLSPRSDHKHSIVISLIQQRKHFFVSICFVIQTPGYMHTSPHRVVFISGAPFVRWIHNECSMLRRGNLHSADDHQTLSFALDVEREMKKQTKFHFYFLAVLERRRVVNKTAETDETQNNW